MSQKKSHSHSYLSFFQQLNHKLAQTQGLGVTLFFDDELSFSCSACGQCCEQPWGIYVSKHYYDNWAIPIADAVNLSIDDLFHRLPPSHQAFALLKKKEATTSCILLAEDKQCLVHRLLGEAAKPEMCKVYPRLTIQAAQTNVLSSSYQSPSCYSVAREEAGQLQLCYEWFEQTLDKPTYFRLSAQKQVDQSAFFLWTGFALDVIVEKKTLSTRLVKLLESIQSLVAENTSLIIADMAYIQFQKILSIHDQNKTLTPLSVAEYQSLCCIVSEVLSPFEGLSDFITWLKRSDPIVQADVLIGEEKERFIAYQCSYFAKQVLTQEYVSGGYINILQQLYLWCKLAFLQTTLSMFFRETESNPREYMGKATNLLHSLVVQSPSNLKQWQLHRWPDPVCYLSLYRFVRGLQILGF